MLTVAVRRQPVDPIAARAGSRRWSRRRSRRSGSASSSCRSPTGPSRQKNSPSSIWRSIGRAPRRCRSAWTRRRARCCQAAAHSITPPSHGQPHERRTTRLDGDMAASSVRLAAGHDLDEHPRGLGPDRGGVVRDAGQRRLEQRAEVRVVEGDEGEVAGQLDAARPAAARQPSASSVLVATSAVGAASSASSASADARAALDRPRTGADQLGVERQAACGQRELEARAALEPARVAGRAGQQGDPAMAVVDEVPDEQVDAPAVLEPTLPCPRRGGSRRRTCRGSPTCRRSR